MRNLRKNKNKCKAIYYFIKSPEPEVLIKIYLIESIFRAYLGKFYSGTISIMYYNMYFIYNQSEIT